VYVCSCIFSGVLLNADSLSDTADTADTVRCIRIIEASHGSPCDSTAFLCTVISCVHVFVYFQWSVAEC